MGAAIAVRHKRYVLPKEELKKKIYSFLCHNGISLAWSDLFYPHVINILGFRETFDRFDLLDVLLELACEGKIVLWHERSHKSGFDDLMFFPRGLWKKETDGLPVGDREELIPDGSVEKVDENRARVIRQYFTMEFLLNKSA